ncbi:MAG: sulfatase-like hydrolase/transferase [Actinomycetota bacterium]|nr:sulfatase-like hydrolase/transferase [Actinomycetota bacterium]
MRRPNVFFLVVDSLRADAVFGDHISTHNFDRLADEGAAFHQCICTCTTTTPSFSSLLTGCYPPKHGVRGLQGYRLSNSLTTMAEMFAAAGYKTFAEVTGPLLKETGILRGFETATHRQAYRVPFFEWRDRIVARMQAYPEPWFMLLHIWEVHRPYRSPPDFTKRNDRAGYEAAVAATDEWLGPVFEAAGDALTIVTGDHGESYANSPLEQKVLRGARKARRALKLSRWLPAADKKLAGLAVGHGFALWEHLVRVPLIFNGPGVVQATVSDQVRHVDVLPTIAALCELDAPANIDGRSLVGLMKGTTLPEEPAYMEAVGVKLEGRRITGARVPDWKLLRTGDRTPSLYKLNGGAEPDEKRNVYNRYPEVASSLESYIAEIEAGGTPTAEGSGMSDEEEAIVEQHLRDLGYL